MKILKPGKVEQRKFVCPNCECEFVAAQADRNRQDRDFVSHCPQCDYAGILWVDGEPYEEPTPTQTDKERLSELIDRWRADTSITKTLHAYLIANGVTFREDAP